MNTPSRPSVPVAVYVFLVLGLACVVGVGVLIFRGFQAAQTVRDIRPTDFAEVGQLRFPTQPDPVVREAVLEYVTDSTTTTVPVAFDGGGTICVIDNWALPCAALSTTYDVAFGGKTVAVEGVREGDQVGLQKLQVFSATEQITRPTVGTMFVPWSDAAIAVVTCGKVKTVTSDRSGKLVQLTFRGTTDVWEALQPTQASLVATLNAAREFPCDVYPEVAE